MLDEVLQAESLSGEVEEAKANVGKAFDLLSKDPGRPPTETERLERTRRLAAGD
ncbi:MAG: hypothetical protein QGG36_20215 [Pirellulaceae bacterium]|jgi:hypothetical protein|nr:hypothetical protein [Pirellulaceae bacterium]